MPDSSVRLTKYRSGPILGRMQGDGLGLLRVHG